MIDGILRHAVQTDLGAPDVSAIAGGKMRIVTYHMLARASSLDSVMGSGRAMALLFETDAINAGHWTAVWRDGNGTIHFFDPYGMQPDAELSFRAPGDAAPFKDPQTGVPFLTGLLRQERTHPMINTTRFQSHGKAINTCGRWVGMRLRLRQMSDVSFAQLFGSAGDEMVTSMTFMYTKDFAKVVHGAVSGGDEESSSSSAGGLRLGRSFASARFKPYQGEVPFEFL